MASMLGYLREALVDAGASPEKAQKAAEEAAACENRLATVASKLVLLTWMVGTNIALTVAIVSKLFLTKGA